MSFKAGRADSGVTLIEVAIAATIFIIAFSGLTIAIKSARNNSMNAIIKFSALYYAEGLLDVIQSYPYQDPSYDTALDNTPSMPQNLFNVHISDYTSYDSGSGIYRDSDGSFKEFLKEKALSIKYTPTSVRKTEDISVPEGCKDPEQEKLRRQALDPFVVNAYQANSYLLGAEDNDIADGSDPSKGFFKITDKHLALNIFQGNDLAKYYFMDDVDDFDGYTEVREILPGINATFTVSVSSIFINQTDFSQTITVNNQQAVYTIRQKRYSVMPSLNLSTPIEVAGLVTDLGRKTFLGNFYNTSLFKKVTVRVAWTYPPGSNNESSIVLDGGVINKEQQA